MKSIEQIAAAAIKEKADREKRHNEISLSQAKWDKYAAAWLRLTRKAGELDLPDQEAGAIIITVAEFLTARQLGSRVELFGKQATSSGDHSQEHVAAVLLNAMEPGADPESIGRQWNTAKQWAEDIRNESHQAWLEINEVPYRRSASNGRKIEPDAQDDTAVESTHDSRDKWIYEQAVKLVAWDTIRLQLAKKKKWEGIETPNGVKDAAKRYARRKGLPQPPPRKAGRTARKNTK